MQLSLLVQQEKWQEFDEAWRESMGSPELDDLLAALSLAASKKRIGRCVPLVREQAELLESGGGEGCHQRRVIKEFSLRRIRPAPRLALPAARRHSGLAGVAGVSTSTP